MNIIDLNTKELKKFENGAIIKFETPLWYILTLPQTIRKIEIDKIIFKMFDKLNFIFPTIILFKTDLSEKDFLTIKNDIVDAVLKHNGSQLNEINILFYDINNEIIYKLSEERIGKVC